MREKEIINLRDGCRLGCVCDVEFETCTGNIVSIVALGRSKAFGFSGKGDDIKICWNDIKVIGDDTILVDFDCPQECKRPNNNNFLDSLFKHK